MKNEREKYVNYVLSIRYAIQGNYFMTMLVIVVVFYHEIKDGFRSLLLERQLYQISTN